jgi:hypothetical protein
MWIFLSKLAECAHLTALCRSVVDKVSAPKSYVEYGYQLWSFKTKDTKLEKNALKSTYPKEIIEFRELV